MTAQGVMDILPGKPFYVYIFNMIARPANLPTFMIFHYALNAPICIIHAQDDVPHTLTDEGYAVTKHDNGSTYHTVKAVRYKGQERCDEQVDCPNIVKVLNEDSQTNWQKELVISNEYLTIRNIFTRMLKQFKSLWDGQLYKMNGQSIHFAPHRVDSSTR